MGQIGHIIGIIVIFALLGFALWNYYPSDEVDKLTINALNFPPGSVNPNVTQENLNETICKSGWTSTIRPSTYYTNKLKIKQIEERGYKDTNLSHYEEDHYVPLCVGGHPTDPDNLFPQLWDGEFGARAKDIIEVMVKNEICDGEITLARGQEIFLNDEWVNCIGQETCL